MNAHSRYAVAMSPVESLASRATRMLFGAVKGLVGVWRGRRALEELACFDDRMLKDIGISRADVHTAFDQSLFADPSSMLVTRAAERRQALTRGHMWLAVDNPCAGRSGAPTH